MGKCNISVNHKLNDTQCGKQGPNKRPFTIAHNGVDRFKVVNQKGADISEYFHVSFEKDIVQVEWKQFPSFEEWRKIVGKQ